MSTPTFNRKAIATPFFKGDETAHALWSSMFLHDVLRLAEEAAVDVKAGSLARQAYWLAKKISAKGWDLARGRAIVDKLAAHFEPDRLAAKRSWVPPSMQAVGEQLKSLVDEEAGATGRTAAPSAALAPPAPAPTAEPPPPPMTIAAPEPIAAPVEPAAAPAAPPRPAIASLAGHTRGELAQLAGAVEALRLLEVARMGSTAVAVANLKACAAREGDFGAGARWALEPHAEEIASLETVLADRDGSVLTGTEPAHTIGTMSLDLNFDRVRALMDLALGKVRCASRSAPPSAASSGATQHVILAYLIATADEAGRVETTFKALDERIDVGEAAARRALKALVMSGWLDIEERVRKQAIYTVKIGRSAAASEDRAA